MTRNSAYDIVKSSYLAGLGKSGRTWVQEGDPSKRLKGLGVALMGDGTDLI